MYLTKNNTLLQRVSRYVKSHENLRSRRFAYHDLFFAETRKTKRISRGIALYSFFLWSMKTVCKHLKLVFSHRAYRILALCATALFMYVSFAFFKYQFSLANLWSFIVYSEIFLNVVLALLFGIFLAGQIYKINLMKSKKKALQTQGRLGGIFGAFLTGCPSCSISLASFLGLGSLLSGLPRYGLELKIIALVLLIWSNRSMYKKLWVCEIKRR
jgi:hypothetical protein